MIDDSAAAARRVELYALLGELPRRGAPIEGQHRTTSVRDGYSLETWELGLNGLETVPAYLVRPLGQRGPGPAVLFNHSHGGDLSIGKEELLTGRDYLHATPYARDLVALGFTVLCIDHWGAGQRYGGGEDDLAKEMLWQGRTLWGMRVFDSIRALDFLVQDPLVDPSRVGTVGMSMGSTMAWWLAALDERVKVTVDINCLTDFTTLLHDGGLGRHGLYYFVPGLLRHFTTAEINALISPRAHLALAGRHDPLTPARGLDLIEDELDQVYAEAGVPERWRLSRFDVAHQETAQGRETVLAFLRRHL